MPQYPSAYGGYGGYPQPQAAAAYGGYGAYGYPQPYAAQPAYGGYGGYGADPYAAAAGGGAGGGYGGYGAGGGGGAAGGGGGGGSSTWQVWIAFLCCGTPSTGLAATISRLAIARFSLEAPDELQHQTRWQSVWLCPSMHAVEQPCMLGFICSRLLGIWQAGNQHDGVLRRSSMTIRGGPITTTPPQAPACGTSPLSWPEAQRHRRSCTCPAPPMRCPDLEWTCVLLLLRRLLLLLPGCLRDCGLWTAQAAAAPAPA